MRVAFVLVLIGVALAACPSGTISCVDGLDPCTLPGFDGVSMYPPGASTQYNLTFYDGGNAMPTAHATAGKNIGDAIRPLAQDGTQTGSGAKHVVILGIGMSNANQQFAKFREKFNNNAANGIRGLTKFVNGAHGGWDACRMVTESTNHWNLVAGDLAAEGFTKAQVQVALIKVSNNRPQQQNGAPLVNNNCFSTEASKQFPAHAITTQGHIQTIVTQMKTEFPNLKLAYFISRSYEGWTCACTACAEDPTYRAPVGMEEGVSIKFHIKKQIDGVSGYAYGNGYPWMAWGPYIWNKDDPRSYFEGDGAHPTAVFEQVVADAIHNFFLTQDSTKFWYKKPARRVMRRLMHE